MPIPERVRNNEADNTLEIIWEDGLEQAITYRALRDACQCAFCRAAKLKDGAVLHSPDIRVRSVQDQGYGLQLMFSDGHDRGIYPWPYLRSLKAA